MKKILFVLLACILLCGCEQKEQEHIFSQYGIAITLSGKVQEDPGNTKEAFTLYTNVGTLRFRRFEDEEPLTEENVGMFMENNSVDESVVLTQLDNGGFFFSNLPRDGGDGNMIIEDYYFIQVGNIGWRIKSTNLEKQHNRNEIISVLTSIRFLETAS